MLKFLVIVSIISLCHATKYECVLFDAGTRCEISDLEMTRADPFIEPITPNPNDVTWINLEGTVPILTNCICSALPNLETFYANSVNLEEIEEDAFKSCKNLVYINLDGNYFKKLYRYTFNDLKKLEKLYVSSGDIVNIHIDITNLKQLKTLELQNMGTAVFPVDTLREQTYLRELSLSSNQLFDLDVETLLTYTPNLKVIYLNDNNFKCSRVDVIVEVLKQNQVKLNSWTYKMQERDYLPQQKNGIHCLTDQQWEREVTLYPIVQQNLIRRAEIVKIPPRVESESEKPIIMTALDEKLSEFQEKQMKNIEDLLTNELTSFGKQIGELQEAQTSTISNIKENLEKNLVLLNQKNSDQDKNLARIESNVNNGLFFLNETIAAKSETITDMIEHLGILDNKVSGIETTKSALGGQNSSITEVKGDLDALKDTVDTIKTHQDRKMSKLEKELTDKVKLLEKKIAEMELNIDSSYKKIEDKLQKAQDKKMKELTETCYEILEKKCSEDRCLTF